jgi:adenylyltransferase/sulfurtransferase
VGSIQATETIKVILDIGEILENRMILIDALTMEFRTIKLRRDTSCSLCGDNPTLKGLIDYEQFCGMPAVEI